MEDGQYVVQISESAIKAYRNHANREVQRVNRNLRGLSQDDTDSLTRKPDEQVRVMEEAVKTNLGFLEKLTEVIQQTKGKVALPATDYENASEKVVQDVLQTFVREWSEEGLQERSECYDRLLGALDATLGTQRDSSASSAGSTPAPRVLCPGAHLARIPFEVARRGYQCEACEARPLLFFGSELVRNHFGEDGSITIQPFVLNTCNRFKAEDHVRKISLPQVAVPSLPPMHFGPLVKLYDKADARSSFDAVLTEFCLDTSSNVLRFIRTVAHVVRPGGLWANFGPLAYETDHDDGRGQGMELSWEELKYALSHFFEVQEEEFLDSYHASNAESMMQLQYSCIYFKAIRNEKVSEGIGDK